MSDLLESESLPALERRLEVDRFTQHRPVMDIDGDFSGRRRPSTAILPDVSTRFDRAEGSPYRLRRGAASSLSLLVLAASLAGCEAAVHALHAAVKVLVAVAVALLVLCAIVYCSLWVGLFVRLARRDRWSPVGFAALLCVEHALVLAWQFDSHSTLSTALCVSGAAPLIALIATLWRALAPPERPRRALGALACAAAVVAYQAVVFSAWAARRWVPASPIRAASTGASHRCVVDAFGVVGCEGSNHWGELGVVRERGIPRGWVRVAGGALDVAVDRGVSCALLQRGTVSCWGGERLGFAARNGEPWTVTASENTRAIAVAEDAVYGLREDGSVWQFPAPIAPSLSPAIELSAARGHVCVITASRAVACREVRHGRECRYSVSFAAGAESIAVGSTGAGCAVVRGRSVCWQLEEDGDVAPRDGPDGEMIAVRRFADSLFAWLRRDNTVIAETVMRGYPVVATGVRSLARGGHRAICATTIAGELRCFNSDGGLSARPSPPFE